MESTAVVILIFCAMGLFGLVLWVLVLVKAFHKGDNER